MFNSMSNRRVGRLVQGETFIPEAVSAIMFFYGGIETCAALILI